MPLVSKSEAARLVGVTRQTIHRKIKTGELSATGSEVDTSELIRVFGAISDGTQPVTPTLQPDSAVQTTLQARVDGLESQLAVTREQLADTSKDRDEWREIAKEATSNVKLITNQAAAPNNDNIAIFIAGAFALGLLTTAIYFMVLRNDVTPSDAASLTEPLPEVSYEELIPPPAQVPREVCSIYNINPFSRFDGDDGECSIGYINNKLEDRIRLQNKFPDAEHMRVSPAEELASRCLNDGLLGDEWIAEKCPEAILELADMYDVELHPNELSGKPDLDAYGTAVFRSTLDRLQNERKAAEQGADVTSLEQLSEDAGIDFSNLVAVPVEETEQGADVTGSVTPELQADTAGLVTDPELLKRLRYLRAKKLKTIWTIGMNERPESTISLEQLAEDNRIDLGLLQSIDITDKDIGDYWDSFDP
jgi:hypothetical protein